MINDICDLCKYKVIHWIIINAIKGIFLRLWMEFYHESSSASSGIDMAFSSERWKRMFWEQ